MICIDIQKRFKFSIQKFMIYASPNKSTDFGLQNW